MGRNHRIMDWNPEDTAAWEAGDNKIARRNLVCTVAGHHVAFSIWTLWSVMALFMPMPVYGFSATDKLLLSAVATLVGACARIPYTLRRQWSRAKSGSLIGNCSAVGALGGVGINLALRESYLRSATETSAYWMFLASYVVAAILTWKMYVRRPVSASDAPNLVLTAEPARL
jgi:nitrate/nitrite transporter NarK